MLVLSFGQGTAARSGSTAPLSNLVVILRLEASALVQPLWAGALVQSQEQPLIVELVVHLMQVAQLASLHEVVHLPLADL
jgi:hypothetical protein